MVSYPGKLDHDDNLVDSAGCYGGYMPRDLRTRPIMGSAMAALAVTGCLASLGLAAGCTSVDSRGTVPAPTALAAHSGGTLHVASDGEDDAPGTPTQPLRSIDKAISRSNAHGTIVVASGSYHEELKVESRDGLTITAAPDAEVWLDGSSEITDWTRDGSAWVTTGWRAEFDSSPTFSWGKPDHKKAGWSFLDPAYPMAAHPDQVWVDGKRQEQVGSVSQVKAGTFFVDDEADKLYLGSDPSGAVVRASSLAQALRIRSPQTVFRGIGVRNYAPSVPHMGAVTVEAPEVTLDHVSLVQNATTGLHVLAAKVRLKDITAVDNGMMGITGTRADGLLLERVVARRNNLERFHSSPSAGGVKIGRTVGVVVRDSLFEDNLGNGLWFDESVYDIGVFNSQLLDNAGHGISIEVSGKADVVDNVIARNDGNGIKINDSDDVQLWNNTFASNDRPINVVQDDRDLDPQGSYRNPELPMSWQIRDIVIRNNLVTGSSGNCLLCVEDFTGRMDAGDLDLTVAGNLYHRPDSQSPKWLMVWASGQKDPYVFRSLAQFSKTVGRTDPGRLLTGAPVLTSTLEALPAVRRLDSSVASPIPAPLASRAGVPDGEQHLGAWTP